MKKDLQARKSNCCYNVTRFQFWTDDDVCLDCHVENLYDQGWFYLYTLKCQWDKKHTKVIKRLEENNKHFDNPITNKELYQYVKDYIPALRNSKVSYKNTILYPNGIHETRQFNRFRKIK